MLDFTDKVLRDTDFLCVDIETKDNKLIQYGPGTHRGDGFICGVAMAGKKPSGELHQKYYSFTHPDTTETKRQHNRAVVAEILKQNVPKLGANIAYDAEWLTHEGFEINGKLHDVQYAEPLLNEYSRSYSLNNLAKKYTLRQKKTNVLEEYNTVMGWKGKPIENIWRMPEKVAAEYALVDVELPLEIFKFQRNNLEMQNLWDLYNLETDLIPFLLKMRKHGVPLDMPLLKKMSLHFADTQYQYASEIHKWAGSEFNIGSTAQLAKMFDKHGIVYPRNAPTQKMREKGKTEGNPNLDASVMSALAQRHPICKTILQYRQQTTLINLFLSKYAEFQVDGRLYGQFHPLRSDDYGTVSGRFSGSKPNLQQVSAKKEADEEGEYGGRVVRKLFIPEEGCRWAKLDYSQVEYRIMAHYATGPGAEQLRESYKANKHMDYHQQIVDSTGFSRRDAKRVNFGGMYGIGQATASKLFGWSMDDAEAFLNTYHSAAPYIRDTRNRVSNVAARRGFVFTILGRKARTHSSRKLHSMFNRLIQGSAADIMKKGLVDADKMGLFDVLVPHMTVHDEVDVSYNPDKKEHVEALEELQHVMETTVELSVPLLVDCHTGVNWEDAD